MKTKLITTATSNFDLSFKTRRLRTAELPSKVPECENVVVAVEWSVSNFEKKLWL